MLDEEKVETTRSLAHSLEKTYEKYVSLATYLKDNMYFDLQEFSEQALNDGPSSYGFLIETRKEVSEIYEIVDARAGQISKKYRGAYAKAAKMYEELCEFQTAAEMYLKSDEDLYYDKAMVLFDKVVESKSKEEK